MRGTPSPRAWPQPRHHAPRGHAHARTCRSRSPQSTGWARTHSAARLRPPWCWLTWLLLLGRLSKGLAVRVDARDGCKGWVCWVCVDGCSVARALTGRGGAGGDARAVIAPSSPPSQHYLHGAPLHHQPGPHAPGASARTPARPRTSAQGAVPCATPSPCPCRGPFGAAGGTCLGWRRRQGPAQAVAWCRRRQ